MLVAIASTDGTHVDDHFGRAKRFLIYDINESRQHLLMIRTCPPLSEGNPEHQFNKDKFSQVLEALEGCQRVYCNKIGDKPALELRNKKIEPVIYNGAISGISI